MLAGTDEPVLRHVGVDSGDDLDAGAAQGICDGSGRGLAEDVQRRLLVGDDADRDAARIAPGGRHECELVGGKRPGHATRDDDRHVACEVGAQVVEDLLERAGPERHAMVERRHAASAEHEVARSGVDRHDGRLDEARAVEFGQRGQRVAARVTDAERLAHLQGAVGERVGVGHQRHVHELPGVRAQRHQRLEGGDAASGDDDARSVREMGERPGGHVTVKRATPGARRHP